jgi:hypothetical protein
MAFYIDDCLTIRYDEAIKELIEDLKRHNFCLKIEEDLKDFLSLHIRINKEDGFTWIQRPHLIKNSKAKFGEEVMVIQSHGTPGMPRFKIMHPNNEDNFPIPSQSQYKPSVGMLLHLIKSSRPDLANVFRELSKFMNDASIEAYMEMIREIRFVLETRETCLKLEPNLDDEN